MTRKVADTRPQVGAHLLAVSLGREETRLFLLCEHAHTCRRLITHEDEATPGPMSRLECTWRTETTSKEVFLPPPLPQNSVLYTLVGKWVWESSLCALDSVLYLSNYRQVASNLNTLGLLS